MQRCPKECEGRLSGLKSKKATERPSRDRAASREVTPVRGQGTAWKPRADISRKKEVVKRPRS